MKAIDRIYQYIDVQCIKVSDFERKNSLSNGYLGKMKARNADIGESIMLQIIENCPNLSPLWLLLGEGEMLRSSCDGQPDEPKSEGLMREIELLKAAIRDKEKIIEGLEENQRLLREKIEFLEAKAARSELADGIAAAG